MNIKSNLLTASFIAGSALAFSAGSAQAFSFQTPSDLGTCANALPSLSCTTDDGFTITAGALDPADPDEPLLVTKTVKGVTGIGVELGEEGSNSPTGEGVPDEIDADEYILLESDKDKVFKYIELAFLFNPPAHGDEVKESAVLETAAGTGILTVLNDTQAEYSFNGGPAVIIDALSDSTKQGAGYYQILNPFGEAKVGSVKFLAAGDDPDADHSQHDYSLVAAEALPHHDIPEPATLGALGLVAGALAATRRGKKQAS